MDLRPVQNAKGSTLGRFGGPAYSGDSAGTSGIVGNAVREMRMASGLI